jgi:hypothetical protein
MPMELSGNTAFPPIGEGKYPFTPGPYMVFWFSLASLAVSPNPPAPGAAIIPDLGKSWRQLSQSRDFGALAGILADHSRAPSKEADLGTPPNSNRIVHAEGLSFSGREALFPEPPQTLPSGFLTTDLCYERSSARPFPVYQDGGPAFGYRVECESPGGTADQKVFPASGRRRNRECAQLPLGNHRGSIANRCGCPQW